jgi:hypothetical protein
MSSDPIEGNFRVGKQVDNRRDQTWCSIALG